MAETPSKRRKNGRRAYFEGADDSDMDRLNPYKSQSFRDDFEEGWHEEKLRWEEYRKRKELEDDMV